ncbi:hypothetical protein H2198_009068 [Neophaeococcomyces mojaviensis]|uniref:Uncharacterized protein n=1 Tax=Neophaeococcomyces mojaviensis TaxID=3383035 RepID=A0ACC2ZVQ2_9EURO|nr:hypothetical protein H2198_009068 [Knufia sp. JES_112]
MGRGRPPKPGTAEEKAAARRERVRLNVRALRERRKQEAVPNDVDESSRPKLQWLDSDESRSSSSLGADTMSVSDGASIRRSSNMSSRKSSTTSTSSALLVVNQKNNATAKFPMSVDTNSPYAAAFLGTVRQQFLPDSVYLPPAISNTTGKPWDSDQFLWTPCAFWVTSAHTKASNQERSLLKTALLAIGMLLKSLEYQDASLRIASLEMYRRCIVGIRKSLEPLVGPNPKRPKDTVALYLSCHAAAMFELVQNSDLSATMHHLRGISNLICHLGEDNDEDGKSIAWLLLQDYRFAEMGLCLKFRYASMTSVKNRQYESRHLDQLQPSNRSPQARGSGSNNMLVTITDIADEIASIMVQLDGLRQDLKNTNSLAKLKALLKELDSIFSSYDALYAQLTARYGSAFVSVANDGDDTGIGYLKFKTFDIGAAWCYNLMTQVYCLETSIEVVTLLIQLSRWANSMPSPPDSKDSGEGTEEVDDLSDEAQMREKIQKLRDQHRGVCIQLSQCLQYFLQTDKGITGQSLSIFPLDAAASMIEIEMQRLNADLQDAKEVNASLADFTAISRRRDELHRAGLCCQKMQTRAESFGMPSFYTAGATGASNLSEAGDVHTMTE